MKKFNTILVGVDFSEASKAALIEADYIALWEGADLHVVHVIDMDEADSLMEVAKPNEEIFASLRKSLQNFTEEVTNLSEKKFFHICVGDPFDQTMALAEGTESDLLVVGSHGAGEKHNQVGAIAGQLIRRAPVPVLLVRQQHSIGYKKVVVCVDFSDASDEAVKYAAEIASNENAELRILHVWCDPWDSYGFPIEGLSHFQIADKLEAGKQRAMRKLEVLKSDVIQQYTGIKVSTAMMEGISVAKGIINFATEQQGTDLLVVGTHGHTKISEFFIGTTTERLIHRSPCSVLTVRAPLEK